MESEDIETELPERVATTVVRPVGVFGDDGRTFVFRDADSNVLLSVDKDGTWHAHMDNCDADAVRMEVEWEDPDDIEDALDRVLEPYGLRVDGVFLDDYGQPNRFDTMERDA